MKYTNTSLNNNKNILKFILKYFEFCNQRGKDFILENGIKRWRFNDDDRFMINYTETRNKIFNDNEVMAQNPSLIMFSFTKWIFNYGFQSTFYERIAEMCKIKQIKINVKSQI